MNLEQLVSDVKKLSPQPGEILILSHPANIGPVIRSNLINAISAMKIPHGCQVILLPVGYALGVAQPIPLPVSLPPVVKTWEGQNAKDAPEAKEIQDKAVRKAVEKKMQSVEQYLEGVLTPEVKELARRYGNVERLPPADLERLRAQADLVTWPKVLADIMNPKPPTAFGKPLPGSGAYDHAAAMLGVPQPEGIEASRRAVEAAHYASFGIPPALCGVEEMQAVGAAPKAGKIHKCQYGADGIIIGEKPVLQAGDMLVMEPAPGVEAINVRGKEMPALPFTAAVESVPKSEARLALEYDLRQALQQTEGSAIDRAIRERPEADLLKAWGLVQATKFVEAMEFMGLEQ